MYERYVQMVADSNFSRGNKWGGWCGNVCIDICLGTNCSRQHHWLLRIIELNCTRLTAGDAQVWLHHWWAMMLWNNWASNNLDVFRLLIFCSMIGQWWNNSSLNINNTSSIIPNNNILMVLMLIIAEKATSGWYRRWSKKTIHHQQHMMFFMQYLVWILKTSDNEETISVGVFVNDLRWFSYFISHPSSRINIFFPGLTTMRLE